MEKGQNHVVSLESPMTSEVLTTKDSVAEVSKFPTNAHKRRENGDATDEDSGWLSFLAGKADSSDIGHVTTDQHPGLDELFCTGGPTCQQTGDFSRKTMRNLPVSGGLVE